MKIRQAVESDAQYFIEIKDQLHFKNVQGETTSGGFLLGTDIETYQKYIREENVLVGIDDGKIVGFGIMLKNDTVKNTDLWQRKEMANWTINIEKYDFIPTCYFEQLAFLNGYSRLAMRLCYALAQKAFETHDALFTTTVHSPILNLAAVPYILKSGGSKIGNINEYYEQIGNIISDIYKIDKVDFEEKVQKSIFFKFLNS
ncbi:hypothetical protein [Frigoriflavimonas asaccharolytica]|uniref:N-acetyltransferase domain-containing protein n=1 Tax=Frigoriflavimonas asaccharolytica TaxID=2735899 RepID=A0A8J8K8C2_9FLAO|nr:hypothetical protein [Frigoriflavimonas asaccharolytica]NRS92461.1 hypothetical protein [Frigoriflavimonas asaccharolytica]